MEADRENLAAAMLAVEESYSGLFRGAGVISVRILMPDLLQVDPQHADAPAAPDEPASRSEYLAFFFQNHQMRMFVYAYESGDDTTPVATMDFPLDVWSIPPTPPHTLAIPRAVYGEAHPGSGHGISLRTRRSGGLGPDPNTAALVASLGRATIRELARNVECFQHPLRYRFVVGTRSMTGSVVEITRSDWVDLHAPAPPMGVFGGIYVPCTVESAGFEVGCLYGLGTAPRELESVMWVIPEDLFLPTALSRILLPQAAPPVIVID